MPGCKTERMLALSDAETSIFNVRGTPRVSCMTILTEEFNRRFSVTNRQKDFFLQTQGTQQFTPYLSKLRNMAVEVDQADANSQRPHSCHGNSWLQRRRAPRRSTETWITKTPRHHKTWRGIWKEDFCKKGLHSQSQCRPILRQSQAQTKTAPQAERRPGLQERNRTSNKREMISMWRRALQWSMFPKGKFPQVQLLQQEGWPCQSLRHSNAQEIRERKDNQSHRSCIKPAGHNIWTTYQSTHQNGMCGNFNKCCHKFTSFPPNGSTCRISCCRQKN